MKILTPDEAKAKNYSGYAYHLPEVTCPTTYDSTIYCASCEIIKQLDEMGCQVYQPWIFSNPHIVIHHGRLREE